MAMTNPRPIRPRRGTHQCGAQVGANFCAVPLPSTHPRCPAHAVHVRQRSTGEYRYVSVENVKVGDRIV